MIKYIKNLFKGPELPKVETLEEKTYKIFKATRLHPAIPEGDQEAFNVQCLELLRNEALERVIDEVVGEYAESIIQQAKTEKGLSRRRNRMLGADEVRKRLIQYSQRLENTEEFDPHEPI